MTPLWRIKRISTIIRDTASRWAKRIPAASVPAGLHPHENTFFTRAFFADQ
jgi:hypothetical protein